jgi:3-deoxy-D-manno-octulosonic-acid transferase
MRYFYDFIFLLFFLFSIPKAIKRRRLNPEYKGMLSRRFISPKPQWKDGFPKIWLNGVSVGEVISLGPLVKEFEERYPGIRLIISATTGTGYHRILKLYPNHQAMALPFDFSYCVARRFKKIQPDLIIFAELDLWPNFLSFCKDFKIPFVVVGGRISESSARGYAKIKGLLADPLEAIQLFLAQDEIDAERAIAMGIRESAVKVGGNLKFDLLKTQSPELPKALSVLKQEGQHWLILASTHRPEEKMMLEIIQKMKENLNFPKDWSLILVPRHPERSDEVEKEIVEHGFSCVRFSALESGITRSEGEFILIDKIGVLSSLYGLADLCFVGGSLIPHGGQNMIEPAAMGCPVFFGPHVHNFREAVSLLLNEKGAIRLKNLEECSETLSKLLNETDLRFKLAENARKAVTSRQGVAKNNLDIIEQQIKVFKT